MSPCSRSIHRWTPSDRSRGGRTALHDSSVPPSRRPVPRLAALAVAPLVLVALVASSWTSHAWAAQAPSPEAAGDGLPSHDLWQRAPSEALIAALEPPQLQSLVLEILERNPDLARRRHAVDALAQVAPQRGSLPDPMAGLTWFVLPPETRVGPQRFAVTLSQHFPWFGKLGLRERAALLLAVAELGELEQARIELITETRRLFHELGFLDEQESILRSERQTLARFEEAARARYSAGAGLQQGILRIQAQITRTDERLLMLRERRSELAGRLNRLRDLSAAAPLPETALLEPRTIELDAEALRLRAFELRPDLAADEARIERAKELVELARKERKPDFNVGLGYTYVDRRQDQAGILNPPQDDGQDIVSLSGAVNLPVRRGRLEASLQSALSAQLAAEEARRGRMAQIGNTVGDLGARLPMLLEHWELLEGVLTLQAREALSSAEAAYTTGNLNAVDLLDAEVVMLEVRLGVARTATDWAIALAQLEGAAATAVTARSEP